MLGDFSLVIRQSADAVKKGHKWVGSNADNLVAPIRSQQLPLVDGA